MTKNYQLIIKEEASEETIEAYKWYERQQIELGELFFESLDECYSRLQSNPFANQIQEKTYRQAQVNKFPFVVIYEIIEDVVIVYEVFHTSRNPRWKYPD